MVKLNLLFVNLLFHFLGQVYAKHIYYSKRNWEWKTKNKLELYPVQATDAWLRKIRMLPSFQNEEHNRHKRWIQRYQKLIIRSAVSTWQERLLGEQILAVPGCPGVMGLSKLIRGLSGQPAFCSHRHDLRQKQPKCARDWRTRPAGEGKDHSERRGDQTKVGWSWTWIMESFDLDARATATCQSSLHKSVHWGYLLLGVDTVIGLPSSLGSCPRGPHAAATYASPEATEDHLGNQLVDPLNSFIFLSDTELPEYEHTDFFPYPSLVWLWSLPHSAQTAGKPKPKERVLNLVLVLEKNKLTMSDDKLSYNWDGWQSWF